MKQSDIGMLLVASIFCIFAILIFVTLREGFSSRGEKAQAVAAWYKNGNRSYRSYRDAIPSGDIVEYTDAKKILTRGGTSSVEELSKVVNI